MPASTTPISSFGVYLMKKGTGSTTTYSKLIDIKEFPDLMGKPDEIEVTSLSNDAHMFIPGLKEGSSKDFTCNYTSGDFDTIKALEGTEQELAVWFGNSESGGVYTPDGHDGKFEFKAYVTVSLPGKGVGEALEMTVTVYPTTQIVKAST